MAPGQPRLLVTGATGRIGRMVVDELVTAGVPVRALTRDPAKADFPPAVEVVGGDLTDPDSLDDPLRDTGAVFLVWTLPYAAAPGVIDRIAREPRHVVLLSAPHRTPHPFFRQPNPMAESLAAVEDLIAEVGLAATVVRPGVFASNALHWWAPAIRAGQPVRWPYATAETAPVDDRDVAALIATVLNDPRHAGADYVVTGPDGLSQAEQVRIIGVATGRDVRFEELSPEEFRAATSSTWPPGVVDMLLAAWAATIGHPAHVTTAAADVLHRRAHTFYQWASDNADAFR